MSSFFIDITEVQPSQLYISKSKLEKINEWFDPKDLSLFEPIPVKKLNGNIIFVDGHTRACAAYKAGLKELLVYFEDEDLDWEAYERCVDECKKQGINNISNLCNRIVGDEEYQKLWYGWCDRLHKELEEKRKK